MEVEFRASSPPINNKMDRDKDQSPLQAESLYGLARLFKGASIGHIHLFLSYRTFYHPGFPEFLKKNFIFFLRKILHISKIILRQGK